MNDKELLFSPLEKVRCMVLCQAGEKLRQSNQLNENGKAQCMMVFYTTCANMFTVNYPEFSTHFDAREWDSLPATLTNIKLPSSNKSSSIGKSEGNGPKTDDPNVAVGKFLLKQYSQVCTYVKNTLGPMWRTLKSGESYDQLYAEIKDRAYQLLEDSRLANRLNTSCARAAAEKYKNQYKQASSQEKKAMEGEFIEACKANTRPVYTTRPPLWEPEEFWAFRYYGMPSTLPVEGVASSRPMQALMYEVIDVEASVKDLEGGNGFRGLGRNARRSLMAIAAADSGKDCGGGMKRMKTNDSTAVAAASMVSGQMEASRRTVQDLVQVVAKENARDILKERMQVFTLMQQMGMPVDRDEFTSLLQEYNALLRDQQQAMKDIDKRQDRAASTASALSPLLQVSSPAASSLSSSSTKRASSEGYTRTPETPATVPKEISLMMYDDTSEEEA